MRHPPALPPPPPQTTMTFSHARPHAAPGPIIASLPTNRMADPSVGVPHPSPLSLPLKIAVSFCSRRGGGQGRLVGNAWQGIGFSSNKAYDNNPLKASANYTSSISVGIGRATNWPLARTDILKMTGSRSQQRLLNNCTNKRVTTRHSTCIDNVLNTYGAMVR